MRPARLLLLLALLLLMLVGGVAVSGCGARTRLGTGGGDGGSGGATVDASWTRCADAGPCNPASEFCKEVVGGPPPGVDIHSCEALGSGCHSCDCVIQAGCTCIDDTGHISLVCDVP